MRLKPGITLEHAQEELREALNLLTNAQSGQRYESPWQSYVIAVDQALLHLAVFTEPDLASGLLSPTYWHLLPVAGTGPEAGRVVYRELRTQIATLELAEEELLQLKQYAEPPRRAGGPGHQHSELVGAAPHHQLASALQRRGH
ncbi:hypothetical protein [Streptomyces sp. enrichment culture]|uniref:hypothetical protein n=1 Tax=Streptomyces sp. enrichment culture TaxID=1795815 RepID=UPI003F56338D